MRNKRKHHFENPQEVNISDPNVPVSNTNGKIWKKEKKDSKNKQNSKLKDGKEKATKKERISNKEIKGHPQISKPQLDFNQIHKLSFKPAKNSNSSNSRGDSSNENSQIEYAKALNKAINNLRQDNEEINLNNGILILFYLLFN